MLGRSSSFLPEGGGGGQPPSVPENDVMVPLLAGGTDLENGLSAESAALFHGTRGGTLLEQNAVFGMEGKKRMMTRRDSGIGRRLTPQQSLSAWQFKYDHFMADQPALDTGSFGAGKREFYRRQKEILDGFREVDGLLSNPSLSSEDVERLQRTERGERMSVQLSNFSNVFLLIAKIVAVAESGSLAIIASALDSLLDIVAGAILWWTSASMQVQQPDKYPIGKKRMQPVGIIIFAAIMATIGVQIILEAISQLMAGKTASAAMTWAELYWSIGILVGVILCKVGLFLLCRQYDNDIVQAYAQDHFFDVLTNVVGVAAVCLARMAWWLDPLGAMAISLYTTINWSRTVLENAASLVGQTAPPQFIGKLTYIVYNHHKSIMRIDTVRAWSYGNLYLVEIEIELPEEMPLREAHDIGESLQDKVEALPEVERAHVHLNFFSGPFEYPSKKHSKTPSYLNLRANGGDSFRSSERCDSTGSEAGGEAECN